MTDNLATIAADSDLWRAARAIAQSWGKAWMTSRLTRTISGRTMVWASLTPVQQLRFGSAAVSWMFVWLIAARWWLPAYTGSSLPEIWFVVPAAFAAFVSVAAAPMVRAWSHSRPAGVVRWLRGSDARPTTEVRN